jgi:DNA polymerase I-like protein with 3'-5' exonuclease and polymerase domains|tara:strand:+ start:276 stop:1544 length:1269 start_codon:yes stop_codon:yes gene_type:complete
MRTLPPLPEWVALEHKVAQILATQEQHGWYFDERSAWQLASSLQQELQDLEEVLRTRHPYVAGSEFTPKRNNKTSGYIEGAPFTRLKELNPTSRDHISWILQTYYGWKPTQMTATGKPIVDEVILTEIGSEISTMFARCLTVTKMLGMLSNGMNAWLKLSTKHNRIHHHCSVATATHRCAHRKPNLAQVPSDLEFRALFTATPGQVMVGADLSGIELRMLGHYLSKWDTHFADVLLNGDIHQVNADKVGVSRRQIKTITYAWCYGAGNEKIGHSYDPQLSSAKAKKKGAEIREAFVAAIPGMAELLEAIDIASKRGFVKSIDGRKINLDSPHKALNYLLQSGAGVIAKRWLVINDETIHQTKLCASQLAFIHDELQFECAREHAEDLSTSLVYSAIAAGEYYNLRVPIEAETSEGESWAATH